MARKKSFTGRLLFLVGIPILSSLVAFSLYSFVKETFIKMWSFLGVDTLGWQLFLTFVAAVVLLWLALGAPLSKKGFYRVFDKVY